MYREFEASNEAGTCLWCGRKLKKHFEEVWVNTDDPPPESWDGKTVLLRRNRGRDMTNRRVAYDLHLGDFGMDGQGRFCTIKCGYLFANSAAANGYRFNPKED